MIVHMRGRICEQTASKVVLEVHDIGYELGVSATTSAQLAGVGADAYLFVRMVVREDAQELYGFATQSERSLFDQLRSISGVGPKLALAVLSTFSPEQLYDVVVSEDHGRMCSVSGVGKKMAARLIIELQSVMQKHPDFAHLAGSSTSLGSTFPAVSSSTGFLGSVKEGLLSMGFSSQEVELALVGYDEVGITNEKDALVYALRRLGSAR